MAHGQDHAPQVGNEPDEPDHKAVPVEPDLHPLQVAADDHGGPDGMPEHEPQCDLTGERMGFQDIEPSLCQPVHGQSARYIECKSRPEGHYMPWLQDPGDPLGPDTGGIEYQCKGDQHGGKYHHRSADFNS